MGLQMTGASEFCIKNDPNDNQGYIGYHCAPVFNPKCALPGIVCGWIQPIQPAQMINKLPPGLSTLSAATTASKTTAASAASTESGSPLRLWPSFIDGEIASVH